MVKMETRHPVEGSYGSEFLAICNHCVVMAAWSCWNFWEIFAFFGQTNPCAKIFKIQFRKFSLSCSNVVKFGRQEIGEIVRYLPDKKTKFRLPLKLATARIAAKICQGQLRTMYSECSGFHSNRFTFGGVVAKRVNTTKLPCRLKPIFDRSLSSCRIKTACSSSYVVWAKVIKWQRL